MIGVDSTHNLGLEMIYIYTSILLYGLYTIVMEIFLQFIEDYHFKSLHRSTTNNHRIKPILGVDSTHNLGLETTQVHAYISLSKLYAMIMRFFY